MTDTSKIENKENISAVEVMAKNEIHGHRIIRELGRGAQGTTYLAERRDTAFSGGTTSVVIKKIIMHRGWDDYDNFRSESEILRHLDIQGVPRLYESIEALEENPPACYIVQEYIHGKSLAEWQNSGRIFTVSDIINIFRQVFEILGKIHALTPPLIHRDLKISNIMYDDVNDKVTLIDFGLAQKQQMETNTRVDGTFGYIAQEQLMGKALPASDIYAAGVSILSMIFKTDPMDFPRVGYDIDLKSLFKDKDEESCLYRRSQLRISDVFPSVENFQLYKLLNNLVSPHPAKRLCDTSAIISLLNKSDAQIKEYISGSRAKINHQKASKIVSRISIVLAFVIFFILWVYVFVFRR